MEDIIQKKDVATYIYITNVDLKRQTFTIPSSQAALLKNHILLLNDYAFQLCW